MVSPPASRKLQHGFQLSCFNAHRSQTQPASRGRPQRPRQGPGDEVDASPLAQRGLGWASSTCWLRAQDRQGKEERCQPFIRSVPPHSLQQSLPEHLLPGAEDMQPKDMAVGGCSRVRGKTDATTRQACTPHAGRGPLWPVPSPACSMGHWIHTCLLPRPTPGQGRGGGHLPCKPRAPSGPRRHPLNANYVKLDA